MSTDIYARIVNFRCNSHHTTCKETVVSHNKYYNLKDELECFIRYKTRARAVEPFMSDKARIASVVNSFKNDLFIPILSLCLTKNFQYRCCISRENRGKSFVKIYVCFITCKDFFTAMIFFVLCSWIINESWSNVIRWKGSPCWNTVYPIFPLYIKIFSIINN